MIDEFEKQLWGLPMQIRRIYFRLDREAKADFDANFRRHRAMCQKCGIDPDPNWVRESLTDIRHDIKAMAAGQ